MKNILRDPRPNFECNKQYGNPSNHAVFYSALLTWFIAEHFYCEKKFRFKYNSIKILCFLITPFILYSRIYLNYHTREQVKINLKIFIFLYFYWNFDGFCNRTIMVEYCYKIDFKKRKFFYENFKIFSYSKYHNR